MIQGDRPTVLTYVGAALALAFSIGLAHAERRAPPNRSPNVILIITDDQGYGDLRVHGNPRLDTPNLDRLARGAVQFQPFYVSPVCSPTRASVMTGRYNYRTGVVDTYLGRSLMHPDETTIAELLSQAGYRTGIFGKWHLGDNYPMRAMDRGFQESLVLNGGGIGQPSDPVGGESYFDPMLQHNGRWLKTKGYVSDVITDAALVFIRQHQRQPFFTYLAFNAPHVPLEVPENKYAKYKRMNLQAEDFAGSGHSVAKRSPLFVRWPGVFPPRIVDRIAAHIDLAPTLVEICGAARPARAFDGTSLVPLLRGEDAQWPDRTLFFQWHRGDAPELHRAFAARSRRYKVLQPQGNGGNPLPSEFTVQLYDMADDPLEQRDVAAAHPEIVRQMTNAYEAWFRDVTTSGRDYTDRGVPRISVGSPHENPVRLTRQDWRGAQAGWTSTSVGHWEVDVRRDGAYDITLRFAKLNKPGAVSFALGERNLQKNVPEGATTARFNRVHLARGAGRLESWVTLDDRRIGMLDVVVTHVDASK